MTTLEISSAVAEASPAAPGATLSAWGRLPARGRELLTEDLERTTVGAALCRGLGRSYGDSSLPALVGDKVVATRLANRILSFDEETGDLVGEAGVSLAELNRLLLQADFTALEKNAELIGDAFELLGGVDTALIAHGDLGDQLATERSFVDAERTLRTNLLSVISLLIPLANRMESARRGRIGVITSVAAEGGRPRNYTYGAAKGALNVYLQGLRSRLHAAGVSVTTLKLGPVDTPMTHDHAKHALFGKPKGVARGIVRALDAGVPEAYVPSFWRVVMPIVRGTSEALFQRHPFLSGR